MTSPLRRSIKAVKSDTRFFRVQAIPHRRGEVLLTAADAHGARLSAEGRQRRAVALVGVDDVSHPGARHVIVEDAALAAARAALHRLEDGQGIVPVRIQQARDARREVRRVLLERAGAQRLLPRAADGEAVADGVGLVAVPETTHASPMRRTGL